MNDAPYIHHETLHGMDQPAALVPLLHDRFHPNSVVDVGCGVGNYLAAFRERGAVVHGVDGPWTDVSAHLSDAEFTVADLTEPLTLQRSFDLAISMEVAEHLPPEAADTFVATLVGLADRIVFSAAVPGQGGQNHLNEQWQSYWVEKFAAHGYAASQALAREIWNDERVFWWYRQNLLVFEKGGQPEPIADVVHPAMYDEHRDRHSTVMSGDASLATYGRMLWKKAFH